ncbi:MAG: diaminopimelate epimerase [Lentisphaeria bacterium]|nr:diaminopimelate epimerase [Lentisphaeria bacterium]NQZ67352.1 diaminopimelate epimerase [Lentisphaeria bacterium]
MNLEFIKMHGLGNDYIYFDCINENKIEDPAAVARQLSDRHFSIGGDGIVLILPHDDADFHMRMFNADGSEAEMCGNAIRCVGKYVYDTGYTQAEVIRVMTGNGILTLELTIEGNECSKVRVDMGEPILNGPDIPVAIEANPVLNQVITANSNSYEFTAVSMGNPHAIIFVDEISDEQVLTDGPVLELDVVFPKKINVEFVKVNSRSDISMRVWERGSGETMACGTGACAVAVASILNGKADRNVTIHLRGGDLEIEWSEADNHVYMTGPATFAFKGTVNI